MIWNKTPVYRISVKNNVFRYRYMKSEIYFFNYTTKKLPLRRAMMLWKMFCLGKLHSWYTYLKKIFFLFSKNDFRFWLTEYYIVLQIKRQIMYIMGRLGWHMSGQPMIFTYVQYSLVFQYSLIHDLALYIQGILWYYFKCRCYWYSKRATAFLQKMLNVHT